MASFATERVVEPAPALEVRDWRVRFAMRGGVLSRVTDYFTAVDGVSFTLTPGKILAVVGESGCGKSTLVKSLVGLVPADQGEYRLFGERVDFKSAASVKRVRNLVQMIFQDPFSSLNPRQTVTEIMTAPLVARGVVFDTAQKRALELLDRVSLSSGAMDKFPHEFSGGQRQRLCIARSLMVSPKVLLCDEVTSALDVSVQAQILHLLDDLRTDLGLSIVFISHDMQVVRALSDEVLVMYFGKVVERGISDEVLVNPQHEYTQKLLASVPTIKRD
ncbi:MAG: ATP-binding cassette domain-containing protein [Fibrobacter sp.]|jgi:ABC-type glutathione transport system ATPase component|uniref:ABC transporter ATP-binding protein n=1 Tax=Fibrobacter sp. UWP2 TaxID=1896216 RepID=UPI000919DC42|nr:ATP-binding cassette domain-containing protein [Fibrobacter sp. UWP2]MBO7383088.1 ABC transporter ATP-binding protein [Fibrobacter sp.]MCR5378332.1 ATP-binding cassette domain-containing protein [Fibrobacter sp.]SHI38225.1 peptide/nickel transport system ATP-binding protein [Fibrobacter sp. UWP2]